MLVFFAENHLLLYKKYKKGNHEFFRIIKDVRINNISLYDTKEFSSCSFIFFYVRNKENIYNIPIFIIASLEVSVR